MTKRIGVWVVAWLALASVPVFAQCLSAVQPVSVSGVFPNHEAELVAVAGSRLGMAKLDVSRITNQIWFGVYDANHQQIGSDTLVVPTSDAGPLALLWNGNEYALFYRTQVVPQLMMQRVDANGNAFGDPVPIAPNHAQFPGQNFDVAWDATRNEYIFARTVLNGFDRGLWLTAVGRDGTQISDNQLTFIVSDNPNPRIAVTSSGIVGLSWIRVNNGQQELAFATATPGNPVPSITGVATNVADVRLATNDHVFFEIYQAPGPSGTTQIRSATLDTTGRIVAPDATLILPSSVDVVPQSLTANNTLGEWGVLYVDAPGGIATVPQFTRLRQIPYNGGPQGDTFFSPDTSKGAIPPTGNLVWDGSSYLGAIGRTLSPAEGTESYLVSHCPLLAIVTASPLIANPNQPVTFSAQATGGGTLITYSWKFGDISAIETGQTVTHRYPQIGTYVATVTATDVAGGVATASVTVRIANLKHRAAGK